MTSLSIGIDLGSHWTRVGIIEESGEFRMIYKMRSVFAFDQDQSEVPIFGEEALKAESYKIIAGDSVMPIAIRILQPNMPNPKSLHQQYRCKLMKLFHFSAMPTDYDWKNQGSYDLALINDASNGNGAKATTCAVGQQAIIAAILAHLKAEVVKQFKSCQECHAIIAVPSFAGDNHRRVILEAAELAGCFTSIRLLNQTTATLIAYNFYQQQAQCNSQKPANVDDQHQLFGLICFGANIFECSLFHPFDVNNVFSPKLVATAGTTELGSAAFTDRLAKWCLAQIGPDDSNNLGMNVRKQIWEKCEEAKKRLSEQESTTIGLHYLDKENGLKALNLDIQRTDFEHKCQPLLSKLGQFLERTFGPSRGKIGRLLLVGWGWRMPGLMQIVEPFLAENWVKLGSGNHMTVRGDNVVKGAAIKAAEVERRQQNGNNSHPLEDLLYRRVDLAFPTIGISLSLFKPGMQIPTEESPHFKFDRTQEDTEFLLTENGLQIGNIRLRENAIGDFKQFAFHIDLNGLLQVRSYFYSSRGEHSAVISCVDWPNLYGNDGLNELREELENLSILLRANADSKDRVEEEDVEGEDKNAPNIGKTMAELNLLDKKWPAGLGNGVDVGQNASSSTRSIAKTTASKLLSLAEKFHPLALAPTTTSSSKWARDGQLANRIYSHCREVMGDIGKLSSSKLNLDLGHCKMELSDIYAKLNKSNCECWPLYVEFLAKAETLRAKHWAHQNCQKVLQIVRNNQWNPSFRMINGPSPFHFTFLTRRLEREFLSKLAQCADQEMVNGLYAAFVQSIRKEMKHENFEDAEELKHLLDEKYTCHYQPIGHE